MFQLLGQRVAVVWVTGKAARADDQAALGGDRDPGFDVELVGLAGLVNAKTSPQYSALDYSAIAQVIAGPLNQVEHEAPISLIKIGKPHAECGCLIVRLYRAFGEQFFDADPQGFAELVQGQQGWKRCAALEAGDRLGIHANPFGKVGLGPLSGLA